MTDGVKGLLGCLSTLVGGGILLVLFTLGGFEGSERSLLFREGVALVCALAISAFVWVRSVKHRDFLLGAFIGVGVLALLWGVCTAAFTRA